MASCLNCGMLARPEQLPPNDLKCFGVELRRRLPSSGHVPTELANAICAAGEHSSLGDNALFIKGFVLEERECGSFCQFVPAFETPREHYQMIALQEAREARRESAAALKESAAAIKESSIAARESAKALYAISEVHREVKELTEKFHQWQIQQVAGVKWYQSAVFWAAAAAVAAIASAAVAIMK